MDHEELYDKFKQLPKATKLKSIKKLLSEKADDESYLELVELVVKFHESNLDPNVPLQEDFTIFSSSEDFTGIEEMTEGEEQMESIQAVSFDTVLLLQDFAQEMGEDKLKASDVLIEEADDLTYLKLTLNCDSDQWPLYKIDLFLNKGFIFKVQSKEETSEGKLTVIVYIYGLLPEGLCFN